MFSRFFFTRSSRLLSGCVLHLLLALFVFSLAAPIQAATPAEPKTALVLATFGSTVPQKTDYLALVRQEMQKRHPGIPQFVAYTSTHVAKTLRERGEEARNLMQVLADLAADGYGRVIVQSLHVTPGKEFDVVRDTAALFPGLEKGALATGTGLPLIGSHEDAEKLAAVLASSLPKERKKGEAVVFVGHGAESPSGSLAYPALQSFLWRMDAGLFVGTIEGPYALEKVLESVKAVKPGNVWLVPLLTVVGDHAQNDIFGDEDDSWKKTFTQAGMKVKILDRGLLALPGVASLFADHADAAFAGLDGSGEE